VNRSFPYVPSAEGRNSSTVFVRNKGVSCAVLSGAQERLRSSNFYIPKDFEYVYEYGETA